MLETLQRGFRSARERFTGQATLDDANIAAALSEVRTSLLEADVDLGVVREFLAKVRERCQGELVRLEAGKKSGQKLRVTPGDHFTKACYEELVALMGEGQPFEIAKGRTRVIMLLGLQGTGKTTTIAKLARWLKKGGEKPLLVAADVRRPAAREQLRVLGDSIGVPVFSREGDDAPAICAEALAHAREQRFTTVLIDTAGRLQIDDQMMAELERLKEAISPDEILLVVDGMTGQEAVKIAQGFDERLGITGIIMTKLDGDARGGAALSIYGVTKKPIKYIGVGEKADALEDFHPDRMASRILQQGDVLSLVEKAQESFDADEAKRLEKKVRKEGMDLQDFLGAMKQMERLGPLESVLKMIPGVNTKALKQVKQMDPRRIKHLEAIVLSMTPAERKTPGIINGSRRARIAKGCGRPVNEVNRLLDQFKEMQKMMKKVAAMQGGGGKVRPGMFGGMM